jgi:hypothetical protein
MLDPPDTGQSGQIVGHLVRARPHVEFTQRLHAPL